ncbi:MAG: winged helix-turn-helix domain-containing protein [Succinivibrionaceae bacterium]|nr:winged helix-turn-helix domain-containing protein [Succinivibrionaceae bacterium]
MKGLSGQGADLRIEAQLLDGLYSGLLQGLEPSAPPDLDHDQPCLEVGNFCLSSSNDECMGGADSALLDGLDRDLAGQRVLGLAPAALLFCHALASPSHACFPLCMAALSLRAALQRGGMPFIRMACLEGALLEVRSGLGELSLRTVPDADLARSATALLISVLHGLALTLSRRLESGQVSAGPAQDGLPAQILALLRERGRISAGELMGELSAPRSTVRYHMAALARQGLVMGHGVGRGAFYTLRHGALGAD